MPNATIGNSLEVTIEMLGAGMLAYAEFDPEKEEPEALIWEILSRAFEAIDRDHSQP